LPGEDLQRERLNTEPHCAIGLKEGGGNKGISPTKRCGGRRGLPSSEGAGPGKETKEAKKVDGMQEIT